MKGVRILLGVLALGLLLALAVGLSLAQEPEPEDEVQPQGDVSIVATVSSKISYQGVLKESGTPVNGTRTITFTLYSDDSCSTDVDTIVEHDVPITDGLFGVDLDVDQSDFDGRGLWLGAEVGGTKIGCQEILPVPYALSLRPGAHIEGALNNAPALYVHNDGEGIAVGLWATSKNAAGVYGQSTNGIGVSGVGGDNSIGTQGWNTGSGVGVQGFSMSGYAGYFMGDVAQNRTGDGLVKASAYAMCGATGSSIVRSFNNVGGTITIANGASAGKCAIDFGFQVDDRYWVVTAPSSGDRLATCYASSANELRCFRFTADGSGQNGSIMVLVY